MTMIAAKVIDGLPLVDIYLACDSRVNFFTEDAKKHTSCPDSKKNSSFTDLANKIIQVNDNLVIAYAGDYYESNIAIEKVKSEKIDFTKDTFEIACKITNELGCICKETKDSFFICIKDSKKNKWTLYYVDENTFMPMLKSSGLHLIGMGKEEQDKFRCAYEKSFKENTNPSSLDAVYLVPITSAFHDSYGQDIGGIISIYKFNQQGIFRSGIAINEDGQNWTAYSPHDKNTTTRYFNGKEYDTTSNDFRNIHDSRNNYCNDLGRYLKNKKK